MRARQFCFCEYLDTEFLVLRTDSVRRALVSGWPVLNTFNRGSEFISQDFQKMIKEDYAVKAKPRTVRNPQANAIAERVHQVIGNIILTFEL